MATEADSAPLPPLAHTIKSASEVLHLSPKTFRKEVLPEIAVVRRGARVIVPHSELVRWLRDHAAAL